MGEVANVVGSVASAVTALFGGKTAEDAANEAAARAAAAAKQATATSSSENAAAPTESKAKAAAAVNTAALRRSGVQRTVNRVVEPGRRTTLG